MVFAYSTSSRLNDVGHGINSTTTTIQLNNGAGSNHFIPCAGQCSGHGVCDPIACYCNGDWYGAHCDQRDIFDVHVNAMIHGIMMYLAFMFLFPIGIAWARYAKEDGSNRWFTIHQTIQGTTSTFLLAAIILAVVLVWSSSDIKEMLNGSVHAPLGFVIVSLGILQLITAVFRPKYKPTQTKTLSRKIFEYFHVWLGRILIVLGWINAHYGILVLDIDEVFRYVHIAIILTWIGIVLVLEIRNRCSSSPTTHFRIP